MAHSNTHSSLQHAIYEADAWYKVAMSVAHGSILYTIYKAEVLMAPKYVAVHSIVRGWLCTHEY